MNGAAEAGSQRRRWLVALGVASSLAFMALAVRRLEFGQISGAIGRARLLPWWPLAAAAYLLGHLVRGVRCGLLVSREAKLTIPVATNVVVLGYAVNNIVPARLGEFARASMLSEKSGLPFAQSLSVTFLERLLDGLVLVGFLIVASFHFPDASWVRPSVELGVLVFGVASTGVLVAVLAPTFLLTTVSRMALPLGPRVHARLVSFTSQASRGVAYIGRPTQAILAIGLSVVVWLVEGSMFFLLLPAFGIKAEPSVALLALSVTNLGILVPSSPGFIGPFHFFCMQALGAAGVDTATAFGYAVLVHLTFFVPITAWGAVVLTGWGVSVGDAVARARSAGPLELTTELLEEETRPSVRGAAPPASRFIVALVDALCPRQEPLVPADRERVVQDVARFVEGQLAALPGRLVFLFDVGMLGFRFLTRLRYLRGFCDLPAEKRSAWCSLWAYGPVSLTRKLFRAPRSTALVGYYDHALVRAALSSGSPPIALAPAS